MMNKNESIDISAISRARTQNPLYCCFWLCFWRDSLSEVGLVGGNLYPLQSDLGYPATSNQHFLAFKNENVPELTLLVYVIVIN